MHRTLDLFGIVQDLWGAGLWTLSVSVCLFSVLYPYSKLLAVIYLRVVCQKPQSRLLRLLDVVGKFSLLDTFMMLLMAHALEVKNEFVVSEIVLGFGFYLFQAATILSIAIGNLAVCGFLDDTPVFDHQAVFFATDDQQVTSRPFRWSPYLRYPCLALVIFSSLAASVSPILRYNFNGMATLETGFSKDISFWNFSDCIAGRIVFICCIVVPPLFVALYPELRFLVAWCATDVFLLCAVLGLQQLDEFVHFFIGFPTVSYYVYRVHVELLWPIHVMAFAVVIPWILTFWLVWG